MKVVFSILFNEAFSKRNRKYSTEIQPFGTEKTIYHFATVFLIRDFDTVLRRWKDRCPLAVAVADDFRRRKDRCPSTVAVADLRSRDSEADLCHWKDRCPFTFV